jgi:hypothetical protein
MRRRISRPPIAARARHAITALSLLLLLGCGDEAGGPSISFESVFSSDEAVVEDRAGETMLRMEGIAFNAGTAVLTAASLPVLDKFATVFEALPGARYSIEAHTDERGASADNLALSQARAAAVRDYLVAVVGGPAVAFTTVGYGESLPLDPSSNAAAWALNERIEIVVKDDAGDAVFRVMVAVDRLDVILDCDDFTSSPSAAAGDFYMQAEFYSVDDRGTVLADRSPNTLVRLNAGESRELDIVAEELFIASDDAVLTAYVDWLENDTGDVEQFELTRQINLQYRPDERCWEDLDAVIVIGSGDPDPSAYCTAPRTGEIASGTMSVNQPPSASVDGCIADLDWSVWVEQVAP